MATYRSSGNLDDPSMEDGDRGFLGINQREAPNQLKPGEIAESLNGRIDGDWRPRKGIELKSGTLAVSSKPLRMPFWLADSPLTITGATRASNVVTLTVAGGHNLDYSDFADATLDPAGADNTILITADNAGEDGQNISVEIVDHPTDDHGFDILQDGTNFSVRAGDYSGRATVTVTGGGNIPSGTYTLTQTGSASQDWHWTTDGLPWDGTLADTAGRAVLYGSELDGLWQITYDQGDSEGFSILSTGFNNFPLWPDQVGVTPGSVWARTLASNGSIISIAMVKATSQEVIDLINNDNSMSSLVTASAVGAATGFTGDVAQTFLYGGWGNVAYFTLGDPANATDPLTGTNNVEAGAYEMTVTSDTQMTFANTGADETLTIDGTYGYLAATLDDDAVSQVFGVCRFSDPASNLDESALLAVNTSVKKVALANYAITDLPYPTGGLLSDDVELVQAFDRVYLFREGLQPWEWIPQGRNVEAATYTSASGIVNVTLTEHGFTVGDSVTTANIGFATTDPNGTHTVTTIVDVDNFQYVIATGGGDETYTANTGKATAAGFTKVIGGAYTQPQTFSIAGTAATCSGGTLTLTVASNTTFAVGDNVQIFDTDVPELIFIKNRIYKVTAATATTVAFEAPIGDFTGAAAEFVEFGGRISQDVGFIHMPAPPWAVYFQRRLWCPYWYENGGTGVSPTYTDRKLRDDIVASDILDSTTFDRVLNQFRTTGGSADYLVGMQPFYDDNMIMLNRNSLHLLTGTQGSLGDTKMIEMTREVGCLARKSVAAQGNQIFFLSDSGVYALSFIDEYNLRGVEEPISKKISPYIDRINESLADKAVGTYFKNRYYLAVPLDSAEGADNALGNNTILVYNLLNKEWESIDSIGGGEFLVEDFVIGQAGERNDLYIVNQVGGLHLADALTFAKDTYSLDVIGTTRTQGITYKLKSRGYDLGSFGRKKFRNAQVQMQSEIDNATDVAFRFNSEDPDTADFEVTDVETLLSSWSGGPALLPANESGNFRFRLGNPRGFYGQLTIQGKIVGSQAIGRPRVTSIKIEGTETNRNTLTQY